MKKYLRILSTILALCMLLGASTACADSVKRFTIGTGGTSGAMYPMGVSMGETITDHAEGLAATGEATAASIENLRNLHQGMMGMGTAMTDVASLAYQGKGEWDGMAFTDIRSLFSMFPGHLVVFTAENSDVHSVADLKGRAIGVGAAGSGGEMMARELLALYGLSYDDVRPQFIPDAEGVEALKDGKIDAIIVTLSLNSAALLDLTSSMDTRIIQLDDELFYEAFKAYVPYTIPGGYYADIEEDVVTPQDFVAMYTSTNSGLTDDEVYAIVKAIWENRSEWETSHAQAKNTTLENALLGLDVPLHPGALRYYEEIGLEIPDYLRP